MKKLIYRIAATTLLIGSLIFNFALNMGDNTIQNSSLRSMISVAEASGESGYGLACRFYPDFGCLYSTAPLSICYYYDSCSV